MRNRDSGLYIDMDSLGRYAKNTARSIGKSGTVRAAGSADETVKSLRRMKAVTEKAERFAAGSTQLPAELEWLLDNWHIAEREGKEAVFRLRGAGRLPAAEKSCRTAVGEAAAALVQAGRGEVTAARIELFLEAYQTVIPLTDAELALFTVFLKSALVRFLAEVGGALEQTMAGVESDPEMPLILENIFTALRFLSTFDFAGVMERVNRLEQVFSEDPARIYPLMDEETRCSYRQATARMAKKQHMSEYDAARAILELAKTGTEKHIGYYIFRQPMGKTRRQAKGGVYIALIVLASVFFTLLTGILLDAPLISLLLFFPITEVVKNLTDFLAVRLVRPRKIPRLELKDGLPKAGRTVCVISALLGTEADGEKYAGLLEEYRLANRDAGRELLFGILADLPEAQESAEPEDAPRIDGAVRAIEGLNAKYGGGFYLFLRERHYNAANGCYMGWERKRGAITELVRLLVGKPTALHCAVGDALGLEGVNFIITLDSDTRLCAGTARELIGAALHPLNTPLIDQERRVVIAGSGILQPRVSIDLAAAGRSDFTRIFAGQGGIDPYGSATSDVYQDLFGAGSFTGKGVINVPAFDVCLDGRFPENRVLSHDLLEGAYLHCSYVGDVEMTDGFPYKVVSFYARMHRWVRGDWQAAPWLFGWVRSGNGERERNPLREIDRWKIFDNLRRSLVPVFTFVALLAAMLLSGTALMWAGIVAVLTIMSNLLLSSAELVLRRDPGTKARYHSTIISGFAGWLLQTIIRLMLLPYEAWVCASAAATALYRMCVSKKNLLCWVTAADAERKTGNGVVENYRKLWPCAVFGVAVLLLSNHVLAIATGVVWLFTPLYALSLSRELPEDATLSGPDRLLLQSAAGDIWKYFEDFLTPEDNWLPPDNWQEQPAAGLAHRTSPTNIGLALLAALAAADLGLAAPHRAVGLVENMLATILRLPKWRGHLYNWYDTRTLRPLEPAYVSTVDSGNLAGSLITLREGLLERGETALAAQADGLLREMCFTPLYDPKRRLFYIGWDMEKNAPTEGWYDLLASEARQTSYVAIARGDVPVRHWRRLGRALVSQDNYSGMVSWTGTMFEYLMPNLLMPCYKNSLIYESLKFCVYAQKRCAGHLPWGMSESAFYAFDPALNYRYKAHGVQRLALKREMGQDTVIAPYAAFLALAVDRRSGVKNLRRMRDMGFEGRYGFYEAVDFTPARMQESGGTLVRTFMVHHLAMSLLSVDNVLCDNVMQRRFMRDREMSAFRELLQEKVPIGAIVLRQPPRDVPEKPRRADGVGWSSASDCRNAAAPGCCLLSNGVYSVLLTETGMSRSNWGKIAITRFEPRQFSEKNGVTFSLQWEGGRLPLTPSPYFDGRVTYQSEFCGAYGQILAQKQGITAAMRVQVPETDAGELRIVELLNTGTETLEAVLTCAFEPVFMPREDFEAHPAFARLSLEMAASEEMLTIYRRGGGRHAGGALCFACSESTEFCPAKGDAPLSVFGPPVAAPEAFVTAAVHITLEPNKKQEVRFAMAPAQNDRDAADAARRILQGTSVRGTSRLDALAQVLDMRPADVERAMQLLPEIVFITPRRRENAARIAAGHGGQRELWQFGISGDLPIVAAEVRNTESLQQGLELIRQHALLTMCGEQFDLVLLLADGSDYRQPLRMAVMDFLRASGRENVLGVKAGVHLAVSGAPGTETILALAAYIVETDGLTEIPALSAYPQIDAETLRSGDTPEMQYQDDGAFVFTMAGRLPGAAWSHVLTNGQYGYLATECGTGNMWYKNARENRINRWLNDSMATVGTETLELWHNGERYALFAREDGMPCQVTYGFGYARWEKKIGAFRTAVTAFVPPDADARVLLLELDAVPEGTSVAYCSDLVLGAAENTGACIMTGFDGTFFARNTCSGEYPETEFRVVAAEPPYACTGDKLAWTLGKVDGTTGAGLLPCAGVVYAARPRMVLVTGCGDRQVLERFTDFSEAQAALERTKIWWKERVCPLTVRTPDSMLNAYVSGWSLYQTLACRVMARTSIYQSGGAYGFRDQLQDVCALVDTLPDVAAAQIVNAAAHQYEEGDVQHWWHPAGRAGTDKGVRTRYSDDLLWLPYTLCLFVEKTGDQQLCFEKAPYLRSPMLGAEAAERYEQPEVSPEMDTLLGHAMRAVELVLRRGVGTHGLCLMGSGDWNDGMNLVGSEGKGESVWLTWFAAMTIERMAELCRQCGSADAAERYCYAALRLRRAANMAWNGKWFLRGYYDDGKPLGAAENRECRIDSIAQSFAAFGGGEPVKVKTALYSALDQLFDRENRIVRLFTPSFSGMEERPGYIAEYSPGFRENGGQYTHGAVWLAIALLQQGMTGEGYAVLRALLPSDREHATYLREPYVIAADVYTAPGYVGRGGWSWYTGAAGWFHRAAVNTLLGLHVRGGRLFIEPKLPPDWPGYDVLWNTPAGALRIQVRQAGQYEIQVNGHPYDQTGYALGIHNNFISNVGEV